MNKNTASGCKVKQRKFMKLNIKF